MARHSREQAAATRHAILERAVDLGSVRGLEGVSVGRLAGELGMSKSGVIGQFGSKQDLQREAVDAAVARFREEVWDPVADEPEGLPRLRALARVWLAYLERRVFPGGCFLTAASLEFDDRPGPVRDAIAGYFEAWLQVIEHEVERAQAAGDLPAEHSPDQVAFELNSLVMGANWAYQLHRDRLAFDRAHAAIERLLGGLPVDQPTVGR